MNKESLKPFVCRIINNALRFKKYTKIPRGLFIYLDDESGLGLEFFESLIKLPRGLLIYLDDKSGLGLEFFESLIKLAPVFVYKIQGGFQVTLFTGINNKSIFIHICKP